MDLTQLNTYKLLEVSGLEHHMLLELPFEALDITFEVCAIDLGNEVGSLSCYVIVLLKVRFHFKIAPVCEATALDCIFQFSANHPLLLNLKLVDDEGDNSLQLGLEVAHLLPMLNIGHYLVAYVRVAVSSALHPVLREAGGKALGEHETEWNGVLTRVNHSGVIIRNRD